MGRVDRAIVRLRTPDFSKTMAFRWICRKIKDGQNDLGS
jgi:hypothetical protein